jgi:hypothetical protein
LIICDGLYKEPPRKFVDFGHREKREKKDKEEYRYFVSP